MKEFWRQLWDALDSLSMKDPANPTGNELSDAFGDTQREALSSAATIALDFVEKGDWPALFGDLGTESVPTDRRVV